MAETLGDVQWKGRKQAIEVSLISEQADACGMFFHLFFILYQFSGRKTTFK